MTSTLVSALSRVITEEPNPPDVPAEPARICMKALRKKREDRYTSAEDFLYDLMRWLNQEEEAELRKQQADNDAVSAKA